MKQAPENTLTLFIKADPPRKEKTRKTKGQSLVELAISLPIIIMMFSMVVEVGFMLNLYLSLLDSTRDSARYWSNADIYQDDKVSDNMTFYTNALNDVRKALDPLIEDPTYQGRRVLLDPATDDVIVSVYSLGGTVVAHPNAGPQHLYNNGLFTSNFTVAKVTANRVADAPNAGMLIVEVIYRYQQVLGLPWMKPFDPITLRAYTIMPIRSAEPVVTP